MKQEDNEAAVRLLRLPEVLRRTGLSRSHLWRLAKRGTFPRPVHFGRSAFWSSQAVNRWVADVIQRDGGKEVGHG